MYNKIVELVFLGLMGLCIVPLNIRLSKYLGFVDKPNARRVNKVVMPSSGGISVYIIVMIGLYINRSSLPKDLYIGLLVGGSIIFLVGLLDDLLELKAWVKSLGIAVGIISFLQISNNLIKNISLPFTEYKIEFNDFSYVVTFIWLFAIINMINLIDGLDGLATGVSIISSATMGLIGYFYLPQPLNSVVLIQALVLITGLSSFIPYNFNPAKIYLGDSGALYIGFILGVISSQGLKNATMLSLLTPMIVLGVPITDTLYAIIRRKLNGTKVSEADRGHLHHRLLSLGFTHRMTVLLIYGLCIVFSFIALLFKYSSGVATILLIVAIVIGVELFVEVIGLMGEERMPIINLVKKMIGKKKV